MSIIHFNNIIESEIIDKSYQLSNYKDDIITYHWLEKNIILDIIIKENICAINKNNDVLWFSFDDENIENVLSKLLTIINY
jgi:hypothetical protein